MTDMDEEIVEADYDFPPGIPVTTALCCCFLMEMLVAGSIYLWITLHNWDDQATIRRRFVCVAMVMLVAAFLVFSSPAVPKYQGPPRLEGLWQALPLSYAFLPLFFLGPFFANMINANVRI